MSKSRHDATTIGIGFEEEQEMSTSKTPISRREILIGGAATVAVVALPRRRNKFKEKPT